MTDKEELVCEHEGCGEKVRATTATVCGRYAELEGKVYCPTHRNERLSEYLCVECRSLVRPEAKKASEDQFGQVYCLNCQKKGLAVPAVKEETALAVTYPIVSPAITPKAALSAWTDFLELKHNIKSEADVTIIAGKEYLNKSFWRKMATFFNLSDRIVHKEIIDDSRGQIISAYYEVEVIAPNGRKSVGIGFCEISERQSGRMSFAHPGHDVRATAHTRGKNRAISDLIAGVEVSAEEMLADA